MIWLEPEESKDALDRVVQTRVAVSEKQACLQAKIVGGKSL